MVTVHAHAYGRPYASHCPWPASVAYRVLLGLFPTPLYRPWRLHFHQCLRPSQTSLAEIFRLPRHCQMEHEGSDNVQMECWTCTAWSFLRQVSTASNLKSHQVFKTPLLQACFVRLLQSSSWENVLAWLLCHVFWVYADTQFLGCFYSDHAVHLVCWLFLLLDHAIILHPLEFFLDTITECYWHLSRTMCHRWNTWVELDFVFSRKTT